MKNGGTRATAPGLGNALARALAIAALFFAAGVWAAAPPAKPADGLTDADKVCLGCHGSEGLKKELASGESLSLHVDAAAFGSSVHRPIGCAGCHTGVKLPEHPANPRKIASAREYTAEQTESCRACHDRVFKAYEASFHAQRAREGNTAAPGCGSCHAPHAVVPPSIQEGTNNICLTCHAGVGEKHQKWLPNASRHLDAVSCSGCHAPVALKKVDLRLYDAAGQKRIADLDGLLDLGKRARAADTDGNGLDPMELRALLADVNRVVPGATLVGHIEVKNGIEAHELPAKSSAINNCARCHSEGATPFQAVSVSAIGPDSRMVRYDAQNSVLTSALTVGSLRGFYAIGGTRIKALDILLALALVGGISVPLLHILVRRLLAKGRTKDDGK